MPETTSKTRKYKVEVIETLSRVIEVEIPDNGSDAECEAIAKVKQMYRNEEIVLTDNDYVCAEFKLVE